MQIIWTVYVLKCCQYVKGRINLSLGYKKIKEISELSHQLRNVCFWTGLLCSNWLCQTEELDEAQANCGLFI